MSSPESTNAIYVHDINVLTNELTDRLEILAETFYFYFF